MHLGLRLCTERGLSITSVELDSLLIVNCFNDHMPNASISHVYREGNGLADRLAARGHTCQGIAIFDRDSLPPSCFAAYQADLSGQPQYRPP
ncbi:hypothetical protein CFOL_v3_06902 [Cephalotus follicularis]|uniref:RVT_3 domain-containing protein n=1 Tax=Cephalotus follicularis TaxID=3775 RepID=A0A1Q3B6A1_CEPFO|nr:hypothetical protein CFOL_v3_06902 [Cephalotus follicularis]